MTHRAPEPASDTRTPAETQQPAQDQRDRVFEAGVSVLRMAVPTVWGGAVAWLAARGLHVPDVVAEGVQWGVMVATTAAWYASWHRIEEHLPPWLTRLVLGSNTAPSYHR